MGSLGYGETLYTTQHCTVFQSFKCHADQWGDGHLVARRRQASEPRLLLLPADPVLLLAQKPPCEGSSEGGKQE